MSLDELLGKDSSVSIQVQNLQVLATEAHKVGTELSTPIMEDIFPINQNRYTLRDLTSTLCFLDDY